MFQFDWTIDFGQILTLIGLLLGFYGTAISLYHKIDKRMAGFEQTLLTHATTLTDHATRLERYEQVLFTITGDLQRVIGRVETSALARDSQRSRGAS